MSKRVTGFACDITIPADNHDVRLVVSVEVKDGKVFTRRCNVGYAGVNTFGAWGTVQNAVIDADRAEFVAFGWGGGDTAPNRPQVVIQGVVDKDGDAAVSVTGVNQHEYLYASGKKKKGFVNIAPKMPEAVD